MKLEARALSMALHLLPKRSICKDNIVNICSLNDALIRSLQNSAHNFKDNSLTFDIKSYSTIDDPLTPVGWTSDSSCPIPEDADEFPIPRLNIDTFETLETTSLFAYIVAAIRSLGDEDKSDLALVGYALPKGQCPLPAPHF